MYGSHFLISIFSTSAMSKRNIYPSSSPVPSPQRPQNEYENYIITHVYLVPAHSYTPNAVPSPSSTSFSSPRSQEIEDRIELKHVTVPGTYAPAPTVRGNGTAAVTVLYRELICFSAQISDFSTIEDPSLSASRIYQFKSKDEEPVCKDKDVL